MNAPARYQGPSGDVEAIQYRPDIPNCRAVDTFCEGHENASGCTEPHETPVEWVVDAGKSASPGDWIVRHNDQLSVVPDDQFTQHYTPIGDANG